MLKLYPSNRLDRLAEALADDLRTPGPDVFAPETIVVENRGMERWLSMRLAGRMGVWANAKFPFPAGLIGGLMAELVAPEGIDRYTRETMTWALLDLLPTTSRGRGFEEVRGYLKEDADGRQACQLAARLADLFDRCMVYRPGLLREWDEGVDGGWQAELWRALTERLGGVHRAAALDQLVAALRDPARPLRSLARVSLFGLSALPPSYLRVFAVLSERVEVRIYALNPCREYWGDIATRREIARARRRAAGPKDADLHYETGNPLLASLGAMGRDFFDLLIEADAVQSDEWFEPPAGGSLLASVQSDLLELRERGTDAHPAAPAPAADRSIQFHSCHSPMREVEVLHDRLLDLLETLPGLTPRDIVVMAPDIDAYAPAVEAVFGAAAEEGRAIPFALADRNAPRTSATADAVDRILALPGGRFAAGEVLPILENALVRRRCGLAEGDTALVREWAAGSGIRWGLDGAHRETLALPASEQNTWRFGLDRILLGYALPGDGRTLFQGVLPYPGAAGAEPGIAGAFCGFADALADFARGLQRPRPPAEWAGALRELHRRFLPDAADPEADEPSLPAVANELEAETAAAGFSAPVSLAVIRDLVAGRLERRRLASPYLTGGVTFCNLLPMRSVPFRVVCLLGMDDGAFPRVQRPVAFDLIAAHPARGDRTRRGDDRYLFLESLLSAREVLYVSYGGQSVVDDSERPPSVLVSELLDYLDQGFAFGKGGARAALVTRHPLQPFSPRYFDGADPRLFSYARRYAEAGAALLRERSGPPAIFAAPLPPPQPVWLDIPLATLLRFFAQPTSFLLRERLGARTPYETGAGEDSEPFELDRRLGPEWTGLLAGRALRGETGAPAGELLRAAGVLPHGTRGEREALEIDAAARQLAGRLRPWLAGTPCAPVAGELAAEGVRLHWALHDVRPAGRVIWRGGKVRPKDRLGAWIEHLALNASGALPVGTAAATLVAGTDDAVRFGPVSGAREFLGALATLYARGLREPLRFFPRTSLAYAETLRKKGDPDAAFLAARRAWTSSHGRTEGEDQSDPWLGVAWAAQDPLGGDFAVLACAVYDPLLDGSEETP